MQHPTIPIVFGGLLLALLFLAVGGIAQDQNMEQPVHVDSNLLFSEFVRFDANHLTADGRELDLQNAEFEILPSQQSSVFVEFRQQNQPTIQNDSLQYRLIARLEIQAELLNLSDRNAEMFAYLDKENSWVSNPDCILLRLSGGQNNYRCFLSPTIELNDAFQQGLRLNLLVTSSIPQRVRINSASIAMIISNSPLLSNSSEWFGENVQPIVLDENVLVDLNGSNPAVLDENLSTEETIPSDEPTDVDSDSSEETLIEETIPDSQKESLRNESFQIQKNQANAVSLQTKKFELSVLEETVRCAGTQCNVPIRITNFSSNYLCFDSEQLLAKNRAIHDQEQWTEKKEKVRKNILQETVVTKKCVAGTIEENSCFVRAKTKANDSKAKRVECGFFLDQEPGTMESPRKLPNADSNSSEIQPVSEMETWCQIKVAKKVGEQIAERTVKTETSGENCVAPNSSQANFLSFLVPAASRGKYDLQFGPFTIDPYWYSDLNTDFDQNEYSNYPTPHDFNYTKASNQGNLVLNGELDQNRETVNQVVSDPNLFLYLNFDDSNATHFFDKSANHRDSNINGTVPAISSGILGSKGAVFNGSASNFVEVPGNKLINTQTFWTISLWFKRNTTSGADYLFAETSSAGTNGIYIATSANGVVDCNVQGAGASGRFFGTSQTGVLNDKLHHVVFTFDGLTYTCYLDGNNVGSAMDTFGAFTGIDSVTVGLRKWNNEADKTNAVIDDVRVLNRTLNAVDVNQLFLQGAMDKNLLGYWKFNDTNGTFAQDFSAYDNDVNLMGGVNTNGRGFFDSNSVLLDGSDDQLQRTTSLNTIGTGEFTLGGWMLDSAGTSPIGTKNIFDSNATNRLNIVWNNTNSAIYLRLGKNGYLYSSCGTTVFPINSWTHIMFTRASTGDLTCYWNGTAVKGKGIVVYTDTNSITGNTPISFSGNWNATGNQWQGRIEDFKLYNRALTATEVLADYQKWWGGEYFSKVFDGGANGTCTDCNFGQIKITVPSDFNAAVSSVKIFGRACTNSACSTNPTWTSDANFKYNAFVDLNAGKGYRGQYYQYRLDFDFNKAKANALPDFNQTPFVSDVNVLYYSVTAPDINITKIDGTLDTLGQPYYSYNKDGNLTIDFNVQDDSNNLKIDLNYSTSATINTGTPIVTGLDLNRLPTTGPYNCQDTNFQNSTQCSIDWNILNIPDANYWIHITVTDGTNLDQNTSDKIFNVAPYLYKCGTYTSDQNWTDQNTYYLSCNTTISGTDTNLWVQAGAVVKFNSGTQLVIQSGAGIQTFGNKNAVAADGNVAWAYFTSKDDNSIGKSIATSDGKPNAGDWAYLLISSTAFGQDINGINLRYSTQGVFLGSTTGVSGIQNSDINNNSEYAIRLDNGSGNAGITNISGNDLNANTSAIYLSDSMGAPLTVWRIGDNNFWCKTTANGITAYSAAPLSIDVNYVENNYFENCSNHILFSPTQDSGAITFYTIQKNVFKGNNSGTGINADNSSATTTPLKPLTIFDNQFLNLSTGIYFYVNNSGGSGTNTVTHNDFNGNTTAIRVDWGTLETITDNIFSNNTTGVLKGAPQATISTLNYNGYWNNTDNTTGISLGANDFIFGTNPFTLGAGTVAFPFNAQSGFFLNKQPLGGRLALDAGSQSALAAGLDQNSAYPSLWPDQGNVDVGFHYTPTRPFVRNRIISPSGGTYTKGTTTTIDFNVQSLDFDANGLKFDLNYSDTNTQKGTGTVIIADANLGMQANCSNNDLDTNRRCTYNWNTSAIPDGNYFILLQVRTDTNQQWSFDASDNNFQLINPAPDINITKIDGNLDAGPFGIFNYFTDGNLTIDFNVMDDTNSLLLDLNYSTSQAINTGTAIVDDLNLSKLGTSGPYQCNDTNFTNSTRCSVDWNISGVSDGNYWIHATVTDGTNTDQNTSDANFRIVNNQAPDLNVVKPEVSGDPAVTDYNVVWDANEQDAGDSLVTSCYADTDASGYTQTYTCFTNVDTNKNQTNSKICDLSSWNAGDYYIWCELNDQRQSNNSIKQDYSQGYITQSIVSLTMKDADLNLGTLFVLDSNTSESDANGFWLENNGNVQEDVKISATQLFVQASGTSGYFRFKTSDVESGTLGPGSLLTYTNVPLDTNLTFAYSVDFDSAMDEFRVDLNVLVPSDEPSGLKSTEITFLAVQAS